MTKNRRLKTEIRAQQISTGAPYLEARRQITDPAATPPAAIAGAAERVTVQPPLTAWAVPKRCRWLADLQEQHGPLIALRISPGDGWWDLDDLAREVAGALQDRPSAERGFWLGYGRYTITKREHLSGIAAKLDAAGALPRLTVRAMPNAATCTHASCRRRRGEPPSIATHPGGRPESPATGPESRRDRSTAWATDLSLDDVMAREPQLCDHGFGVFVDRSKTVEQRRQQLQSERDDLRRREAIVVRVRDWLLANIAPIKTPTAGSYGMKHVVEKAIGEYITNGELIAAAMMAGYPMSRPHGPNVDFGMSKRDVDAARATR
jgi:hypothetical protein